MAILKAFFRGLPIAALAAGGTLAVTRGNLLAVFVTSLAINFVWTRNVKAVKEGQNQWAFAAGAACGSVITVYLFR